VEVKGGNGLQGLSGVEGGETKRFYVDQNNPIRVNFIGKKAVSEKKMNSIDGVF